MDYQFATTIQSITARAVIVPMEQAHQTAGGAIVESPLVLIDITTTDGLVGRGLIFTYTRLALTGITAFIEQITPLIVNQPLAPTTLTDSLKKRFKLLGTSGLVGMSLAGIDMALWDALSKSREQSLAQMLGVHHKTIPAYANVGYDGEKGSAKNAEHWVKQGFEAVKAKIGYPTAAEDLAVIRAMRSAVGDDVKIMVDYNQSLTPKEAIMRLNTLANEGLTWVEEPILANDFAGHTVILEQTDIPIQCGENWWGKTDVEQAISTSACDYMMLDIMKIGGISEWINCIAITQQQAIKVSSHLFPEVSAKLLFSTPHAAWLEYCDWWNPILQTPLHIEQGKAIIDDTLGIGLEWNESNVAAFLL